MKKTRFLALALVVAIMMMGAGYAWWSQTLTVKADVTTGYLDVAYQNITTTPDPYIEMTATPTNYDLKVNFLKLYPNGSGALSFDVKNTGTMAVKLAKNNAFVIDNLDENGPNGRFFRDDKSIDIQYVIDAAGNKITFSKDADGNYTYTSANPIVIEPGQSAKFIIKATLDKNVGDDSENANQIGFKFVPKFIQFNDTETK